MSVIVNIVCRISHFGDSISNAHIATFTPTCTPGVFQDPYSICPLIVIPTDQDDGVVYVIRTCFVGLENAATIALESTAHTDCNRNRSMVVNGLFDSLDGWNARFTSYKGPGTDFLVMGMGWVAGGITGCVGEIGLIDCPRVGLAWRYPIPMVVVGPPATTAAPVLGVAGNEILL